MRYITANGSYEIRSQNVFYDCCMYFNLFSVLLLLEYELAVFGIDLSYV